MRSSFKELPLIQMLSSLLLQWKTLLLTCSAKPMQQKDHDAVKVSGSREGVKPWHNATHGHLHPINSLFPRPPRPHYPTITSSLYRCLSLPHSHCSISTKNSHIAIKELIIIPRFRRHTSLLCSSTGGKKTSSRAQILWEKTPKSRSWSIKL